MKKEVSELQVIRNTRLNHDNYLIELKAAKKLHFINPGQFVNVLVKGSPETFLRRPFSIHDVDYELNTVTILVKVVGKGTQKLSEAVDGEMLDMIFPLGNGYSLPSKGEKILLIGGGVGIAPMMHMARESVKNGAKVHILLGARSKADHILIEQFENLGQLHLTTDDGSLGTKGFVTNHAIMSSEHRFDKYYCCGPDAMMHAVARRAKEQGTDCEVSLENMMACGFGVCLCCVTKTNEGNKCVCTEGPVFNINELKWQI